MPRVVPSQIADLIDKLFPNARTATEQTNFMLSRGQSTAIAGLLELVDKLPHSLITVSGDQYAEFVTSVAALRTLSEQWVHRDYAFVSVPGLRRLNPVVIIRQILASCDDEFPSPETSELAFITDTNLRANLRLDTSATNSALTNGEWKAATVLAGSVIEALLLWKLQEQDLADVLASAKRLGIRVNSNLEEWVLHQYLEVAAELRLIKDETTILCRLAKDFRNLIHPGCAQRFGQVCNRGTALSAVAALEHVIYDLTP